MALSSEAVSRIALHRLHNNNTNNNIIMMVNIKIINQKILSCRENLTDTHVGKALKI